MRSRLIAAILVVAAWFTTVCTVMEPSHACCQNATKRIAAALPACCTVQAIVQPQDQQASNGFDLDTWVTATRLEPLNFLTRTVEQASQSRLASSHTPDQSDRYLELRVLLN